VDTLGYPLITGSDAHYVEHVGRRSFDLPVSAEQCSEAKAHGRISLSVIRTALSNCPRS